VTIEIKQLVIRAVVDGHREPTPRSTDPLVSELAKPARLEHDSVSPSQERALIIATCVREVLRKLERSHQR